jgi:hypothetical protein
MAGFQTHFSPTGEEALKKDGENASSEKGGGDFPQTFLSAGLSGLTAPPAPLPVNTIRSLGENPV